ncbi:MAG TPA: nuclear transport factor 2 family protein [Alphaproteobacteria bacterium]|nr:nuclear transport factor 2 family protein [Alphaproteobacteria bacterium]
MSGEANKKLVLDAWEAFWRGDIESGLACFADDATWTVPGLMKTSGIKRGKDEIRRFREGILGIFSELDRRLVALHAGEDVVILESAVTSRLKDGKAYENAACSVWEIRGGKVREVREYLDTAKAQAVNDVV